HSENINHSVQITETAVVSDSIINETRFQFIHLDAEATANSLNPAIQVLGSFNGGGAQVGHSIDVRNNYELQNMTSITRGRHAWKFGIRLREETDVNPASQNFGGTFTLGGGTAPELGSNNQPVLDPSGQLVFVPITSIERYRRTLEFQRLGFTPVEIRALGGGATQFSMNAGDPRVA